MVSAHRRHLVTSCASYLFDFSLQVPQLNALLQVPAVLLGRHVELLLLLVEELEQVLHPCGHIDIPVAQQLHTWRQDTHTDMSFVGTQETSTHDGSVRSQILCVNIKNFNIRQFR